MKRTPTLILAIVISTPKSELPKGSTASTMIGGIMTSFGASQKKNWFTPAGTKFSLVRSLTGSAIIWPSPQKGISFLPPRRVIGIPTRFGPVRS